MVGAENMECIAVVDSNHSLMNFKLFGKKGGSYCIDIDDASAKHKEDKYYTLHEARDAESMLEWLLGEYRPLPKESTIKIIEKILRNENKIFPFLEEYIFCNNLTRLPYFQRIDGRILSYRPKENEKLWVVSDEELHIIYADGLQNIASLIVEHFGKFVPFGIITVVWYNEKMQQWEEWKSPIVYKFQSPAPLLVKRYDVVDESPWPLESATIEYGWSIDYHRFITTQGEIAESSETYTASTTAEVVREWDRWTN